MTINRVLKGVILSSTILIIIGCSGAQPTIGEENVVGVTKLDSVGESSKSESTPLKELPIWTTRAQVESDCDAILSRAEEFLAAVLSEPQKRNQDNAAVPFNSLLIELSNLGGFTMLYSGVSPVEEVRDACEKCRRKLTEFDSRTPDIPRVTC